MLIVLVSPPAANVKLAGLTDIEELPDDWLIVTVPLMLAVVLCSSLTVKVFAVIVVLACTDTAISTVYWALPPGSPDGVYTPPEAVTAVPFTLTEVIEAPPVGVTLNACTFDVNVTVAAVAVAEILWFPPAVTNAAKADWVTATVAVCPPFIVTVIVPVL